MVLYVWLMVMSLQPLLAQTDSSCILPTHWKGRWYNNKLTNVDEVTIKDDSITDIGECKANLGSRYYMHNIEKNCYKCLLVIDRHHNIIQYRESHCGADKGLTTTCKEIAVEMPLHTLVRAGAHVDCPFSKMRSFAYDNNTSVYCDSPKSEVQTCSSNQKMTFTFGSCPNVANTMDTAYELDCLATWKDGSSEFLYTSVNHQMSPSGSPVFRCFTYTKHGPEIRGSMSLDTSCRAFVQLILKEEGGVPCNFIHWLQGPSWQDTSGKMIYKVVDGGKQLQANKYREQTGRTRTTHKYTCISDITNTSTSQVIIAKTVHKCDSSYQCVKILRRTDHVVQLIEGGRSKKIPSNCRNAFSSQKSIHSTSILVKDTQTQTHCAIPGIYTTIDRSQSGGKCFSSSMEIGCKNPSRINTHHLKNENKGHKMAEFLCLQQWTSPEGNQHIIGRNRKTNDFICLVYDRTGATPVITISTNCQSHRGEICKVEYTACPGKQRHIDDGGGGDGTIYSDNPQDNEVFTPTNSAPLQWVNTYTIIVLSYILVMLCVTQR